MHRDFTAAAVKNSCKKRLLETKQREHALLDGALRDEVDHLNAALLAHAMHARDALLQHCRIPWLVHVDHGRGVLKIESDPARIGGEEHPALRIVAKALDQIPTLLRWDTAVKQHVAPTPRDDPARNQFQVTRQRVVGGALPRAALGILLAAFGLAATDDEAFVPGKSGELQFPLVLE